MDIFFLCLVLHQLRLSSILRFLSSILTFIVSNFQTALFLVVLSYFLLGCGSDLVMMEVMNLKVESFKCLHMLFCSDAPLICQLR